MTADLMARSGACTDTFQNLDQWVHYIQGVHDRTIDMTLDRVRRVFHVMRLAPFPCTVVVAGTNGKGSSVAMLESVLRHAGYNVGAYTSPHLIHYNERVRINGQSAGDELLCRAFQSVEKARGDIPLTFFEFGTLAALWAFSESKLDSVIMEVGLGGRLDAVNVLAPDVSLITAIGLDHQFWLGGDRESIAREKCGVMRFGRPTISADPNPPATVAEQATIRGARLIQSNVDFGWQEKDGAWNWWINHENGSRSQIEDLPVPLTGTALQRENASGVIAVVRALPLAVTEDQIRQGLESATIRGRSEVVTLPSIGGNIEVVFDVAHNIQAVEALAALLHSRPAGGKTRAVFSMLSDKDVAGIVTLVGRHIDTWHIAPIEDERGMGIADLSRQLRDAGVEEPKSSESIDLAFAQAREDSGAGDRIVVFGSFHVVGGVLDVLDRERDG